MPKPGHGYRQALRSPDPEEVLERRRADYDRMPTRDLVAELESLQVRSLKQQAMIEQVIHRLTPARPNERRRVVRGRKLVEEDR